MNDERFWDIVESASLNSTDADQQAEKLKETLKHYSPSQLIEFHKILLSKVWGAWRWDLWDVASILNRGSCSEDGFLYFRGWLISRGKTVYESALSDPSNLAKIVNKDDDYEAEWFLYSAISVYKELTHKEMPRDQFDLRISPKGVKAELIDLPRLYPTICKEFDFEPVVD